MTHSTAEHSTAQHLGKLLNHMLVEGVVQLGARHGNPQSVALALHFQMLKRGCGAVAAHGADRDATQHWHSGGRGEETKHHCAGMMQAVRERRTCAKDVWVKACGTLGGKPPRPAPKDSKNLSHHCAK